MLDTYLYDAAGHDKKIVLTQDVVDNLAEHQLLWIDLVREDADALETAAPLLGADPEALSMITAVKHSSRLYSFDDQFQFSMPTAPGSGSADRRIDFLVSGKWLITVRDDPVPYFDRFRDQDRGESMSGHLTPAAFVAALLDWHLDAYRDDITAIEKETDRIDGEVLASREKRPPLGVLAVMRRRVSRLRSLLGEHRTIILGFLRPDFAHITGHPHEAHFVALAHHYERTEDAVDRAREQVLGSFELYATRTAQDTNQLVKLLTIFTVVLGFIGAVGGVFGMNFETPIPKTGLTGFLVTIAAILVITIAGLIVARMRKWI